MSGSSDTSRELASTTILKLLETHGVTRTCLGCEHWDKENELCVLAGKRPPVRVVIMGCNRFDLTVPF